MRIGNEPIKRVGWWTLLAGSISALILTFFWGLLLLQFLHVSFMESHPFGLYTFVGLFTVALVLSFVAARVGSRYWYLELLLVVLSMVFVLSTLH